MKIVDTSSNTTSQVVCMASSGIQIIFRYYASPSDSWKIITPSEAHAISDAGMQIGVVFEDGSSLDSFTEDNGKKDGRIAYNYATGTINQPFDSAIYFAVDLNVTDAKIQSNIIPYFRGVRKGLEASSGSGKKYKIGAYGCGAVVNTLKDKGLCEFRWLSESISYNGTEEALHNGMYDLAQKYKAGLQVCDIPVDQDVLREGVTDIGTFKFGKIREHD